MKKIISVLLVAVIFACTLAVNVSSAGTLYLDADFTNDATFAQFFYPEAFKAIDGVAVGYSEAKALQSVGKWAAYDVSFDVSFEEDELATGTDRSLSFIYFNNNMLHKGLSDNRLTMSVFFDITKSEVSLVINDFTRSASSEDLVAPVPFVIEDGKEYHLGVSISEGRIRVFSDDTLLIDYVDTANNYYIGYVFEDVDPEILVWWNNNNCAMFSDIKVASPEYLYPPMDVPVDSETTTTATDSTTTPTTTRKEVVDVTDDKGNAVTDADGNKVTEEIIVTDPPVADTNPGANVGGNSTSTGDNTFAVVAAMVATIGCALIIRKVYA